ncbi:helix-turn-helix domain-containing protein [Micromonospora sp. LOL_023]|uniref:helix-turn-helix domain-containing protein n=1 Tax=Micromonospora sp. LOL_023 TaxID=3345418 RepID=UPI003A882B60
MRISDARDLGLFVRQSRQDKGWTQAHLAQQAGVSRRWLSDLEAGKTSAEVGLALRTLSALGATVNVSFPPPGANGIDLDELLKDFEGGRGRAD